MSTEGLCRICHGQLSAHAGDICGSCEQDEIDQREADAIRAEDERPLPFVERWEQRCPTCGAPGRYEGLCGACSRTWSAAL